MSELSSSQQTIYQPTAIQTARTKSLKRFNLLYVYIPIALCSIILLGVIGFLIWITLGGRAEATLTAVSGLADLILIMILLPFILIGLLGPIALGGLIYWLIQQQKKKKESNQPQEGVLIQKQMWKVENLGETVLPKIQTVLDKVAQPIIAINARLESMERFIQKLWNR